MSDIDDSFLSCVQRNYRFFFMFVSSATLLCIYVFGFCWVFILRVRDRENTSIWKAMTNYPASIVLIIYTFIAVWFVGGLTVFHLYLISTNQVKIIKVSFIELHTNLWMQRFIFQVCYFDQCVYFSAVYL